MEYYAKSKSAELSEKEIERLEQECRELALNLEEELSEREKEILLNVRDRIGKQVESHQITLTEHLEETVKCAESFFEQYGTYFTDKEKTLILEACSRHDLGKVNDGFQMVVNRNLRSEKELPKRQIPHGFLSSLTLSKIEFMKLYPNLTPEDFEAFLTAIYYHHTREDNLSDAEILEYSTKYFENNLRDFLDRPEMAIRYTNRGRRLFENNITGFNKKVKEDTWNLYLIIKGMLNKFDWSASAGYGEAEAGSDIIEKKLKNNILEKIGENLRPVQEYMQMHKDDNLVIIAPTGSGKTEAALLWIDGEKGFYTLPLKVSSNAIYRRIKDQYSFDRTALLHSDSMSIYLEESSGALNESPYEKYEKAKLLSSPLTICTVDQLFTFVYKALGTEIFAATLKYSKLVLDEIQSYTPRVVATLIYGLKTIQEMGGKFAIITATFPPVLRDFMARYGLLEDKQYLMQDFSSISLTERHMVSVVEQEMNVEKIAEDSKTKKVLVICNTVNRAQKMYENILEETDDVYLIHSRYIRKDRSFLEKQIMDFSGDEHAKGIWITTQIVEASLDIDFDVLHTEMCTCDSLLQRMGRCNRKGRYVPQEPNIIIYDNKNGIGPVYDKDMYERSVTFLKKYEDIIFTEEMKTEYINQVYKTEEITETSYYKEIERFLGHFHEVKPAEYSKQEADEEFRLIRSITVLPEKIYKEHRELFEYGCDFMKKPHVGSDIKNIIRTKMESLTLSLSLYHGRYPEGVDKAVIRDTDIHRTKLKYEFQNGRGRGLLLDEMEEDDWMF